jgi:hypothetical protein
MIVILERYRHRKPVTGPVYNNEDDTLIQTTAVEIQAFNTAHRADGSLSAFTYIAVSEEVVSLQVTTNTLSNEFEYVIVILRTNEGSLLSQQYLYRQTDENAE